MDFFSDFDLNSPMFRLVDPNDILDQHQVQNQENKPPKRPMRKTAGKKMSARERLLELERQERQQLQMRDQYKEIIKELEMKNNKLKAILANMVTTSPEYNTQMMNFLDF